MEKRDDPLFSTAAGPRIENSREPLRSHQNQLLSYIDKASFSRWIGKMKHDFAFTFRQCQKLQHNDGRHALRTNVGHHMP